MRKRIEPRLDLPQAASKSSPTITPAADEAAYAAGRPRFSLGRITPQNYGRLLLIVWIVMVVANTAGGIGAVYLQRQIIDYRAGPYPTDRAYVGFAGGILGAMISYWIYYACVKRFRLPRLQTRYRTALQNRDRNWVKLLARILRIQLGARFAPPIFAAAAAMTVWLNGAAVLPPAAATTRPGAVEVNGLGPACFKNFAFGAGTQPVEAVVTGFISPTTAAKLILLNEELSGGLIDPDYVHNQRVLVQAANGTTAVLVPDGMTVALGETVRFMPGHKEPGTACNYIPNLIMAPGG